MTTTTKAMNISELESSTREQLLEVAKEVGLEDADSFRKRDLIYRLLQLQAENSGNIFSTIACKNPLVDLNILKGTYVLCRGTLSGPGPILPVKTIFIGVIKNVCCNCVLTFNIELFFLDKDIGIPQFGIPFVDGNSSELPDPWREITLEFWGIRWINYFIKKKC